MKLAVFAALLVIIPFQAVAGSCIGKSVAVWVANGHDLTGDGLLDPDPYVVVKIGGDKRKTKVIENNEDPGWWEEFKFHDVTSDVMRVEVWEADGGIRGDDDHLGTCMEPLLSGGPDYRNIQCKTKNDGFVKLFYRCY